MGGGQSFVGSGLEAGVALPLPRTLVSHTPPGSAPTAPGTCSAPSGFLLLWFPILNPLAQATTSLREDGALSPRQQPPGLMEKAEERTLFEPGGQNYKDAWREPWRPLGGQKAQESLRDPGEVEDMQLDASGHRLISLRGEPQVVGGPQVA